MKGHVLFVAGVDSNLRLPFVSAIRNLGYRVGMAASGGGDAYRQAGIEFYPFDFDRTITPVSDLRSVGALRTILKRVRPDVAQGFDTKPCIMLPIAARGLATRPIRTICGQGWVHSSSSPVATVVRPIYRALHRAASRHTAATVFQLESDHEDFTHHGMMGANGVVIPAGGGGVDVDLFDRKLETAATPEELRREFGFGDRKVITCVSRLTRQKGIPTLLDAAERVHRLRQDVVFLLVGPRESEGPLAVRKAELDRRSEFVCAPGSRDDVYALLRMSDMFVFPTEYSEGVPRALLEAGLASLPIVASAMPGCRTVIDHGKNGLLVRPGDAEGMAQAILSLLDDPSAGREMAARCPQMIRDNFSVRAIAQKHDELYQAILASDGRMAAAE